MDVGEIIDEMTREGEVRREEQAEYVFLYSLIACTYSTNRTTRQPPGLARFTTHVDETMWATSSSRWIMQVCKYAACQSLYGRLLVD